MRVDRVKLIAEMARRGMRCNDLIQRSGLSRSTVTAIRAGKSCSGNTALAVADALGIPVAELLEREAVSDA